MRLPKSLSINKCFKRLKGDVNSESFIRFFESSFLRIYTFGNNLLSGVTTVGSQILEGKSR